MYIEFAALADSSLQGTPMMRGLPTPSSLTLTWADVAYRSLSRSLGLTRLWASIARDESPTHKQGSTGCVRTANIRPPRPHEESYRVMEESNGRERLQSYRTRWHQHPFVV